MNETTIDTTSGDDFDLITQLRADNTRLEAEGAAMRRALEARPQHVVFTSDCDCSLCSFEIKVREALSTPAGKSILEQIARLEGACAAFKADAVVYRTQFNIAQMKVAKLTEVVKACEVALEKLQYSAGSILFDRAGGDKALALIHTLQSGEKKEGAK